VDWKVLDYKNVCRQVRRMGEILNSMKFIKMYAWEKPFNEAIKGLSTLSLYAYTCTHFAHKFIDGIDPFYFLIYAFIKKKLLIKIFKSYCLKIYSILNINFIIPARYLNAMSLVDQTCGARNSGTSCTRRCCRPSPAPSSPWRPPSLPSSPSPSTRPPETTCPRPRYWVTNILNKTPRISP